MKIYAKVLIVAALGVAVLLTLLLKERQVPAKVNQAAPQQTSGAPSQSAARLPKMIDLGADKCIPCKMMAPILATLKKDYAGKFEIEFIDVWKDESAAIKYGIEIIPTQIFFDASGKELFRHTGFYGREDILGKWKELGQDMGSTEPDPIVLEVPKAADSRPKDAICLLCDGDIHPKTKVVVQGQTDQHLLCSMHCYFIYFSSLVNPNVAAEEAKVRVTDWVTGRLVAATTATYLYGMDPQGRPTIKAFADKSAAVQEQQRSPGNLLTFVVLRDKELTTRCGFCDRAVYLEDASKVTVAGTMHTYGCCTHCALGVAARLQKDIEVEAKDGHTGGPVRVKTLDGKIASLEPETAIAWFGQKKSPDGKWVSAGCFKQGFFVNQENLKKWLDARPTMTGRQITIAQALADKMKLTPEQIAKACKLGECK